MESGRREDVSGLHKLEGSVERVIYANEENGYTICDLAASEDGEMITAVGVMPMIGAGDHLCLYGKWVHNPKYGRQFEVSQYERVMPADTASMLRYLASRAIKGIGPKTAQRIIDEFGEDSFDVMENHPEWLASIKGISMKTALAASESFREQAGIRFAMMFFRDYFGVATTVKIYKKWGSGAVDIAKKNPYRLCNEIEGIGFERADALAEGLGFQNDHLERVMSGLRYVLSQNAIQNGHVCLPREKLRDSAAQLLRVSPEQAEEGISLLLKSGALHYVLREGRAMIYNKISYEAEKYVAEKMILLDRMCASLDLRDIDRFIENEEAKCGIRYASLQKKAISDALRYGVMILTGGPGTGKTTVVRALIHIFDSMGYEIALAAPTGRAAKRLSEATSMEAKTLHRLLEMSFEGEERSAFNRNEHNLLDEQVIVVDEASMIDNALMCALLKAIKPGARLIVIGDSDQLPSVGAGNVLRDVIDSGRFATVRLNEIFRQASQSLIVTNAHAVNRGEMPDLTVKDNDFFFLRRGGDREIALTIADLCRNRLPRTYGNLARNGIQVIAPSRKGEAGTESLNLLLQATLNPPSRYLREHKFRDRIFREGDRVMQTRNNYDILWSRSYDDKTGSGIFNGDIGIIEEINEPESYMTILFDDRRLQYDFSLLEDLEHAYAVTVHKSQGSEYPIVILPMCTAAPMLLSRNLLYTAVTRAEKMVILVGREEIVAEMVANNRQTMRYTGLYEWLREEEGK
ncbi:MAG: ATP-dependent RecD-like DNA helicase [Clostridia bacterium]|nr:ATP-dependent RecD-like DNA helicase [Clostridia bacterium]